MPILLSPPPCAVGPFPLENHLFLVPQDLELLIRAFLLNAHQSSIFGAYKLAIQKLFLHIRQLDKHPL